MSFAERVDTPNDERGSNTHQASPTHRPTLYRHLYEAGGLNLTGNVGGSDFGDEDGVMGGNEVAGIRLS